MGSARPIKPKRHVSSEAVDAVQQRLRHGNTDTEAGFVDAVAGSAFTQKQISGFVPANWVVWTF